MANDVKLGASAPLTEELKPLKIGGKSSSLELSQHENGSGARVNGGLDVNGNLKVTDTVSPIEINSSSSQLKLSYDASNYADISVASDGELEIATTGTDPNIRLDSAGTIIFESGSTCTFNSSISLSVGGTKIYFDSTDTFIGSNTDNPEDMVIEADQDILMSPDADLVVDAGGDITLDADGGNITLLDGGSTYTPTASSDAVPLSHLPFVLYSQFQDDLGTSKHYLPLKGYFEQSSVGQEPTGMIAPFNMKLQKIVLRSSEDISGGTWKIGMWMVDSGSTHAHHHTNGFNWIQATGGTADTNATFDFTGTVGLAGSGSGGSNAVTAGQWIDFAIQSDTDVTSSSAEYWITMFFIADLASTI